MKDLSIVRALEALGTSITPEMVKSTMSLFANRALVPDASFCSVNRDVPYGEDSRHRLDIFAPKVASGDLPVLLYVHGGGFVGGDKGAVGEPFYNNVGAWAVRSGFIGVTMTYRLAPAHKWPTGSDDLATAVQWLRANIATHGGNPSSMFVMGQSAGAAHVAGYIGHSRYNAAENVAGAIMLSGIYDLVEMQHGPLENAYFGTDTSQFAIQSAINGLLSSPVPCLYSVSEFDAEVFQRQAAMIIAAHIRKCGLMPRLLYLAGHNHLSPALSIGGEEDLVGTEIAAFVSRALERQARWLRK